MKRIPLLHRTLLPLLCAVSAFGADPDGLVGHWALDETAGLVAADSSGSGQHGTLTNMSSASWVTGQIGGALSLDGLNDMIVVADSDALDLGNTFTLAAWINPRSYANFGRIFNKGSAAGSRYDLALAGSAIQLKTSVDYTTGTGLIGLNSWQHLAVTYDGAKVRVYVQGVERANASLNISIAPSTAPLYMGNLAALTRPLDGKLDDLRIYNRALVPDEIETLAGIVPVEPGTPTHALAFSTYLGGSNWEHARDVCADAAGNVIVVGGTASANFPTTAGAYSRTFNVGVSAPGPGTGAFGNCDGFITKFDRGGKLVWSTFLGGAAYDRIYAVEVDAQGHVYVAGRAGPGFPVTPGAFQKVFAGTSSPGNYGNQNGFVAKLSADGGTLLWATYVGVGELVRDIAIDADGDVYAVLSRATGSQSTMPAAFADAFTHAFRPKFGAKAESGLVKIQGDGSRVLWATWLGGSGDESGPASVRVDADEQPYICFHTSSTDVATAGAGAVTTNAGGVDMFVAKLNASGSALIFGTYLGGAGEDSMETHSLAIDQAGHAYVACHTQSANWPITPGTLGAGLRGASDIGLARIGLDGRRISSTVLGGAGGENPDGIQIDADGRIVLVAESNSADFPVPSGVAHQRANGGGWDGLLCVLSPDLKTMDYGTYLGGSLYDNGRCACLAPDGSIYLAGGTLSPNWPTLRSFQSAFGGGSNAFAPGSGDCILAKFCELADRDGDGSSGLDEFVAGTDALNPADFFRVIDHAMIGTTFQLTVQGKPAHYYILKRSTDLASGNWIEVNRTGALTVDESRTLVDVTPPTVLCFYKVEVVAP